MYAESTISEASRVIPEAPESKFPDEVRADGIVKRIYDKSDEELKTEIARQFSAIQTYNPRKADVAVYVAAYVTISGKTEFRNESAYTSEGSPVPLPPRRPSEESIV